jgi:hypothetical protein
MPICLTNSISICHVCRYRPLAPSVLSEHAADWFDNIPAGEGRSISPYMSMTTTVNEAKRVLVPAVTHIDGTARLQTVDKHSNPLYHMLIERFFKLTKVTVLSTLFSFMQFHSPLFYPTSFHSIPFYSPLFHFLLLCCIASSFISLEHSYLRQEDDSFDYSQLTLKIK